MLNLFRRHKKNCPHRCEGRNYRRCHCPISVEGLLGDDYIRCALKTQDWNRAQDTVRRWEAEQRITARTQPASIAQATENFLADMRARNLSQPTVKKYELLFSRLKDFACDGGYELLRDLDTDAMTRFRATWKYVPRSSQKNPGPHPTKMLGPRASQKMLERLRAFCRFSVDRRWIDENPAKHLKTPKVPDLPTLPFTYDEMTKILAAADSYRYTVRDDGNLHAIRLRSLILLVRYSGLRIGDAVSLSMDRLAGNVLFLYTAKTGTPVRVVLPEFVAEALRKTPPMNDRYWFRTVEAQLSTWTKKWEARLLRLFRDAGIAMGHAHRFRDTFAVELLLAGVPLDRVSVLLGHKSVKVTERHYAPWVHARQEQLERDIAASWCNDPLVQIHANHTRATRAESERPN